MPSVSGCLRRVIFGLTLAALPAAAATAVTNTAGLEFFESKVRPVLVDNCYKCHSRQSEKVRGGLLLDTRDGLRQGGDSGPAIVPGHPERSLLIKAVSYEDKDLQMPPKDRKLPDEQIQNLRAWIKMGAPDPRTGETAATNAIAWTASRKHWAFQPVVEPPLPKGHSHRRWIKNPIDAFVLENLNAKRLKPSPPADKRTLIRRATFDLTGLPPTEEEVNNFLADKSPDAFARVVDRLLASPRYGERWGRYWLDVARYADSRGFVNVNDSSRMPYAYTYRDYVIRSFNEDLPFNQFILEQLAADQLPGNSTDNRRLAAMGFLTVGRQFLGNANEIIDDRIDVVSRGLLGLTVSCARCHDHKFDPIPTRDYYSLHGIFNSSMEPTNLPLLKLPLPAGYTNFLADLRTNQEALDNYVSSNETRVLNQVRSETGSYLLAVHDAAPFATNSLKVEDLLRERKLNKAVYLGWQTNLARLEKTNSRLFAPWAAYAQSAPSTWAGILFDTNVNALLAAAFAKSTPTNLADVAQRYDNVFGRAATNESGGDAAAELRKFMEEPRSPANPPRAEFARAFLFDNTVRNKIINLRRQLADVEATDPGAPARAMVLEDKPHPADSRIFLRGNPGTPGAVAPRGFLQVLNRPGAGPFPKKESGRLELAEDIASPDNPLTARVFVNRVWMHHFDAPLVPSPSDFGVRTPAPVEAKLLDYLAARFMAEGWSVKKLHRLIMLSAVYQQSSAENAVNMKIDPDNAYLWRMNPHRLDFEAMRDSMLFVSGQLDQTMGGQPVNIAVPRRTVYALVDRQNLPGVFRAFDFANPDTSSAGRFETTVAPQALYLMNSPFLAECAAAVTKRCDAAGADSAAAKIRRIYATLFQRAPTPQELEIGVNYISNQPPHDAVVPEPTAWKYGWGTVDASGHVAAFNEMPIFNGQAWRPSKADGKIGFVQLTALGGYAGRSNYVVVRRWVAPRDGTIAISGVLANTQTNGFGVRGRIVSGRGGELGQWRVHNRREEISLKNIEVREGEAVDFIVDSPEGRGGSFVWAPTIEMAKAASEEIGLPHVWDARENFVDPKKVREPLGPWEKYAQVLLFSNEFFFVE